MLFSYDYFSKIKIPSMFIDKINEEMDQIMPGTINFSVELSDSKGRTVTYDFKTGEIISNNNSILTISKYLFLLIVFLF